MPNLNSALVVEDSQTIRLIIARHLNSIGVNEVDEAEDGAAALERLGERRYDLMITDWEMHPVGGEELLKAVRQNPKLAKLPIIMITAAASRGTSWLAGADAYLPKPFTEADLQKAITTIFGAQRP
jgi:two-component system chemotaxis response regulator CheY